MKTSTPFCEAEKPDSQEGKFLVQFLLNDGHGGSGGLQPRRIEGLRQQTAVADIEQVTGGKRNVSPQFLGDSLGLPRVERTHVDAVAGFVVGTAPVDEVEEVLPIGEERRPATSLTAARTGGLSHDSGNSAGGWDTLKRTDAGKDDRPIVAPRTAEAQRGLAENLDRAAGDVRYLQLAFSEEADAAAVRRPEGERGTLTRR